MTRLFLVPGILGAIVMAFWLWAVIDIILTDSMLVRNMQKGTWLFLVLFLSSIGAAAWLLFGRPEGASLVPGGQARYANNPYRTEEPGRYRSGSRSIGATGRPAPIGPEDTPGWQPPKRSSTSESDAVRERRLMEREAELNRREAELAARETSADPAIAAEAEVNAEAEAEVVPEVEVEVDLEQEVDASGAPGASTPEADGPKPTT